MNIITNGKTAETAGAVETAETIKAAGSVETPAINANGSANGASVANGELKVLSQEEVRARVQANKSAGVDLSKLETFEHAGLGGTVYYGPLPSFALHRYENIEQFYPLDHPQAEMRGRKASTPEMDQQNRERLVLQHGVWLQGGKNLDGDSVEFLLNDPASGPDNRDLLLAILRKTFKAAADSKASPGGDNNTIIAFTRWEAAFHDLLVKSGWVEYWVEYVTSDDASTPEAKEAAEKLLKLEAAAPEWSKRLQAQEIVEALNQVEPT